MEVNDILQLISDNKEISNLVSEEFFHSGFSESSRAKVIVSLVKNGDNIHAYKLLRSAVISAGGESEQKICGIEKPYFDECVKLLKIGGIDTAELVNFLIECIGAASFSELKAWSELAHKYLCDLALKNYGEISKIVFSHENANAGINALFEVEPKITAETILEILISGKNSNKTGLRKILYDNNAPVANVLMSVYKGAGVRRRESILRLLLLYKNNPRVSEFLYEAEATEKSVIIKRLLTKDRQTPTKCSFDDALQMFENMLVSGEQLDREEFLSLISQDSNFARVASQLFFSVYVNKMFSGVIIVDDGKVLDLENQPFEPEIGSKIKVLHPVELTTKFTYIKQLNIEQPFAQINRTYFAASDAEKLSNSVQRFNGRVLSVAELKKNFARFGFKILNRGADGKASSAGLERGGIMCVLKFSPISFNHEGTVYIGDVLFFSYSDLIKLRGQIYTDGVPALEISKIAGRTFSEFMYSVSNVLGCI